MAGREKNCRWFFADQPNGQEIGPNNAMAQNFKGNPYAALIRESIQNSLDAVSDKSKPVRMEFEFGELTGSNYENFFKLEDHIQGCLDYYPNNDNASEIYKPMLKHFKGYSKYDKHIGYIRVGDSNTKGMEYGGTDSPFYAFVRSAGVSAKDGSNGRGGSFGFGKAAYYQLSPIGTIFISTLTQGNKYYFEGVASLCTHTLKDRMTGKVTKKINVGYYDDKDGLPISNPADIPNHFVRKMIGTDVFILGFDLTERERACKEMIISTLRNFWFAIYSNKLVVEVGNEIITKDNLTSQMEKYFKESTDETGLFSYYNPRPYYDAVRHADSQSKYKHYTKRLPILGKVHLYTHKLKNAPDKIAYMRSPKMLVFGKKRRPAHGFYGVFLCDDENKGNEILRKLENPAHDEWNKRNWLEKNHYVQKGIDALEELEAFIDECIEDMWHLNERQTINVIGLEDFLYIPTSYEEDEDIEKDSDTGKATGDFKAEGTSPTTDTNPNVANVSSPSSSPSTGQLMINRTMGGTPSENGTLRSGHGEGKRAGKKGIVKAGDVTQQNEPSDNTDDGIYAETIYIPYRTFSQVEDGQVYHYVVLHSTEEVGNVRLRFYSVGEDSNDELGISETNRGNIAGNLIRDIHIDLGSNRIRVRFKDNMKHSIKLTTEEIHGTK